VSTLLLLLGERYSVGDENDEQDEDKIDLFEQDVPDDDED